MVLKSLQELNNDFIEKSQTHGHSADECSVDEPRAKSVLQTKKKVFLAAIAILLLLILLFVAAAGSVNNFLGYSFFAVLSHSMNDEIPKGSLIVVRKTDPLSLIVGDNITYKLDRTTTVTHKVVEIHENYDDSGARGLRTMGINNTNPDTGIVYADSVIGVVSCCIPGLGSVLAYIADNIVIMCILSGGIAAAVFVVKRVLLRRKKQSGHGLMRMMHTKGEKACTG